MFASRYAARVGRVPVDAGLHRPAGRAASAVRVPRPSTSARHGGDDRASRRTTALTGRRRPGSTGPREFMRQVHGADAQVVGPGDRSDGTAVPHADRRRAGHRHARGRAAASGPPTACRCCSPTPGPASSAPRTRSPGRRRRRSWPPAVVGDARARRRPRSRPGSARTSAARCYEVPGDMQDEVAAVEPGTPRPPPPGARRRSTSAPGVRAQLERSACEVVGRRRARARASPPTSSPTAAKVRRPAGQRASSCCGRHRDRSARRSVRVRRIRLPLPSAERASSHRGWPRVERGSRTRRPPPDATRTT